MTSYRPPTDVEHHRSNKIVAQTMEKFAVDLRALPNVNHVSVRPALGQWQGGEELSWSVSYDGNGAARKLIAATGEQWNQDAVLLFHKTDGPGDGIFELDFAHVPLAVRRRIDASLGKRLGGWAWFKRGGRTVFRAASVPAWGMKNSLHGLAMTAVRHVLERVGYVPLASRSIRGYKTEVIQRERNADGSGTTYADVLRGGK
jgi:hypothetical protein